MLVSFPGSFPSLAVELGPYCKRREAKWGPWHTPGPVWSGLFQVLMRAICLVLISTGLLVSLETRWGMGPYPGICRYAWKHMCCWSLEIRWEIGLPYCPRQAPMITHSSMIQLFPPLGWRWQSTGEVSMQVGLVRAKLLHCESKVCPLSSHTQLRLFWCTSGAMTSSIKVLHTPLHSVLMFAEQNSHIASNECCRSLEMRLWVGPLSAQAPEIERAQLPKGGRYFNGPTISTQVPTHDVKLAARVVKIGEWALAQNNGVYPDICRCVWKHMCSWANLLLRLA